MQDRPLSLSHLRDQMIGADACVVTPFGERPMVYADYTASGRGLHFVERYMQQLQEVYANTHTEDSFNGRSMSSLLHQAEARIKRSVNAGPGGRIIALGSGATAAIDKMQQILGIALPPATRRRLEQMIVADLGAERSERLEQFIQQHQPVVFVGPYEHHSNEISWRANLATVVSVDLTPDGGVDVAHLERLLQDPAWRGRPKIGSFSAASNVTGRRSPLRELAILMHQHGGYICVDFAASAPYVEIDMNPPPDASGGDASFDAVFISPHKFLGGPGASGVLVFHERLYQSDLPPSVSGGGTVDYVSPSDQDYIHHIEEREKAGTPGVLQTLRAALAFEIKDRIGVERIEAREQELLNRAFTRWRQNPRIEVLGHQDPSNRIGIVSFNVKGLGERYLHPKFVTALLSDLFGVQTRAGCSCAGPYGHRLLDIGPEISDRYRGWILKGIHGIKPGWCRVSFHYAMDDLEVDYILDAIDFVAEHGVRFLACYRFDLKSGAWHHRRNTSQLPALSLDDALNCTGERRSRRSLAERRAFYNDALRQAHAVLAELQSEASCREVGLGVLEPLQFFTVFEEHAEQAASCATNASAAPDLPTVSLQPTPPHHDSADATLQEDEVKKGIRVQWRLPRWRILGR